MSRDKKVAMKKAGEATKRKGLYEGKEMLKTILSAKEKDEKAGKCSRKARAAKTYWPTRGPAFRATLRVKKPAKIVQKGLPPK